MFGSSLKNLWSNCDAHNSPSQLDEVNFIPQALPQDMVNGNVATCRSESSGLNPDDNNTSVDFKTKEQSSPGVVPERILSDQSPPSTVVCDHVPLCSKPLVGSLSDAVNAEKREQGSGDLEFSKHITTSVVNTSETFLKKLRPRTQSQPAIPNVRNPDQESVKIINALSEDPVEHHSRPSSFAGKRCCKVK